MKYKNLIKIIVLNLVLISFSFFLPNITKGRHSRNINTIRIRVESIKSKKEPSITFIKKAKTKTKKVGFFCGSFNPLHIAHVKLAQEAKDKYNLDEIVYVISKTHVENKQIDLSAAKRLKLLYLYSKNKSWISVVYSNTGLFREMIYPIKFHYGDSKVFFTMGYDNLQMVGEYNSYEQINDIFSKSDFIIASRFEKETKDIKRAINNSTFQNFTRHISLLELPDALSNISSSKIRNLIRENKIKKVLPLIPMEIRSEVLNLYSN